MPIPVAMTESQASSATELLNRYAEARAHSDRLFDIVAPGGMYERPIPERHRIVFYLGHLEAFDWNLFRSSGVSLQSFDPDFDRLFAFGIDPVEGGLPDDPADRWPPLEQIRRYNSRIRETLDAQLESILKNRELLNGHPVSFLLETAIEHRWMHVETLAYMFHQLPLDQKIRPPQPDGAAHSGAPFRAAQMDVPRGGAVMGMPRATGRFGWDNEFEAHSVEVQGFRIDKFKVTNGEYLEFINAGGYRRKDYWAASDWEWKEREGISHPVYWKRSGTSWIFRAMFDEIPLPLDWPVYVSHAEASAYAKWAGRRLPSESEWQRAAFGDGSPHHHPKGNFDFQHWDPVSVQSPSQSAGPFGAVGMIGNGWEWTGSLFKPFPEFRAYPFYPGYSANFFDDRHYAMKGASSRTAACMTRPSFRNWFQPHYQYVYAGFRCVSGEGVGPEGNVRS